MGFDNNYPNRKDWRKPYRKAKAVDRTCRNHGSCPWCRGNQKHRIEKLLSSSNEQLNRDHHVDRLEDTAMQRLRAYEAGN